MRPVAITIYDDSGQKLDQVNLLEPDEADAAVYGSYPLERPVAVPAGGRVYVLIEATNPHVFQEAMTVRRYMHRGVSATPEPSRSSVPRGRIQTDPLAALDGSPATPAARSTDPRTSHRAAQLARPRAGGQRAKLLEAWRRAASNQPRFLGYTADEACRYAGVRLNSGTRRITELVEGGWLEDSGQTRKTEARRDAVVWRLTDAARRLLDVA